MAEVRACAIVGVVSDHLDPDDPRLTAHKMPLAMANETLQDIIGSAQALQLAILADQPDTQLEVIKETARAQLESYIDLMAQAAQHARALKP